MNQAQRPDRIPVGALSCVGGGRRVVGATNYCTGEFGAGIEVLWQEKEREDWLRSLGLGVSRIVWSDLFGAGRRAALKRLTREYLATQARRGARRAS